MSDTGRVPPDRPAASLAAAASALLLLLLPLATIPWLHETFTSGKRLVLLVFGVAPAAALLLAGLRTPHPLRPLRLSILALVAWLLFVSLLRGGLDPPPVHLAPFLFLAAGLIALPEAGFVLAARHGPARVPVLLAAGAIPVLALGILTRYFPEIWPQIRMWIPDRPDAAFSATIGNSNELGEYAVPVFFAALIAAGARASRTTGVLALPALALVLLSGSRGAWLALAAGIATAGIALLRSAPRQSPARRMALGLLLLLAAGAGAGLLIPEARARILSIGDPDHPTNRVRAGLLAAGADMAIANLPLGAGGGRFELEAPGYRSPGEWALSGDATMIEDPHNEYLWALAEGGVPGILALLLVLLSCWRFLRTGAPESGSAPLFERACAAGLFASFLLLLLLRSPLHHPAGCLSFFALAGAMAARGTPGRPHPAPRAALALLLFTTLLAGAVDIHEDRLVALARNAQGRANANLLQPDPDVAAIAGDLGEASNLIRRMGERSWISPHRAYRTALVGSDLAMQRQWWETGEAARAIQARGLPPSDRWLPSAADVLRLLDRTLVLHPGHHEARTVKLQILAGLALDARTRGDGARGDELEARILQTLEEGFAATPQSPRMGPMLARALLDLKHADAAMDIVRRAMDVRPEDPSLPILLGRLALRLGTGPRSFGLYLDAHRSPAGRDPPGALAPAAADAPSELDAERALVHLGRHPASQQALKVVADWGYAQRAGGDEILDMANRAVARQRVLIQAAEGDQAEGSELRVRIALSRDPELLDARYLAARAAATRGDADTVREQLWALKTAGVRIPDLRARIEQDGVGPGARDLLLSNL